MKKKSLMSMFLIGALLLTNGVQASAATDISVNSDTTGSTQLSFTVTADMLGGDLIVSIPAEMILSYNTSTGKFVKDDYVSAKGNIAPDYHLEVSAPTSVTYTHKSKSSVNVNGIIGFGSSGKETWTAEQLTEGFTTPQNRTVTASANLSDVKYIGDYGTNLIYSIKIVED